VTGLPAEPDPSFELLLRYLKETRGFDFTGYKRSSLIRRVQRRMQTVQIGAYEDYQDYLEVHPAEFVALFNTILINVTSFFRDPEAWDHLSEELLPALLRSKPDGPLRIWSAGCASGEEAYSLAIVLAELLGPEDFRRRVKIYATDVDEDALAQARQACYEPRQLRGVSAERMEAYFERSGERYTFHRELRRSVIFGRNDLVQDAPISHIDLLVCRNALMYFNAETQSRILQRLHFALYSAGLLFLGKAEMLLSHDDLFVPIDLKRRFFRKVAATDPRQPMSAVPALAESAGPRARSEWVHARLRDEAFAAGAGAHVVIDQLGRLILANHRAASLFGLTPRDTGRPFQDLELSYRPAELRSIVERAVRERRPHWIREVEWVRGDQTAWFDLQLVPLFENDGEPLGVSVVFNDVTRHRQLQTELEHANRQIEAAYEELQSTNEELETTNEELQSTVEELETTNEELQSTNEELETMNEELQSMNDELQASNEELRERTSEVGKLNQFMESVFTSLRAGVAVVDRDLRVQVWNSRAEDLWGVRRDEAVGEHLLNLDIGLPVDQLKPGVRHVLADGEDGADKLVLGAVNRRGRSVLVEVTTTPLRSGQHEIDGVIIMMDEQSPPDSGGPLEPAGSQVTAASARAHGDGQDR
jgi:two-component system, chemotaxis family, CheB/CheR fusion protein